MPKVHIRKKKISKERQSFYLDFSPPLTNPQTGKPQRYEFLGLFTYDKPATIWERKHNTETNALVESIRATRQLDIQNRKFGFVADRTREQSFIVYYTDYIRSKGSLPNDNLSMSLRYFTDFAGQDVNFFDVDAFLISDYRSYLLGRPSLGQRGRAISYNTASNYFAKLRTVLRRAYKQKLLTEDICNAVEPINPKETHREILELEELQALADTPAKPEIVKKAAIFAGLTGLRFSDVHALRWDEVRGVPGKYKLQFVQEKTEGAEILPISDQAVELLGERGEPHEKVFRELTYSGMRSCFAKWIKDAGIMKNITFHSFRHTFATLQLELGTEIYTVSKMLGHRSLKTTQIYAKVKDKMKVEAAGRIKLKL
jgi:integrase